MEQDADVIQHDIEDTRASLVEKIGALEERVTNTVEQARSTVEDTITSAQNAVTQTVQSVKSTVSETVESVKEAFDLRHQVDRHPFAMVGCSVLTGFLTGKLVGSGRLGFEHWMHAGFVAGHGNGRGTAPSSFASSPAAEAQHFTSVPAQEPLKPEGMKETVSGIASEIGQRFGHELDEVKRLAMDAAISALGGAAVRSFPSFAEHIKELTQHFRTKIGNREAAPRKT